MRNPWVGITLSDYENHMKLGSVGQLQVLNRIMADQLYRYNTASVMILGIAGGNGLDHIQPGSYNKIYGVDINTDYLAACKMRYPALDGIFETISTDLTADQRMLPQADLVIANLLVEYIGYDCLKRVIRLVHPKYVSCAIQINVDDSFVSESPYLQAFDSLKEVHYKISEDGLTQAIQKIGFTLCFSEVYPLPNGKILQRLDYKVDG